MTFVCATCPKVFPAKWRLERHQNKKKSCNFEDVMRRRRISGRHRRRYTNEYNHHKNFQIFAIFLQICTRYNTTNRFFGGVEVELMCDEVGCKKQLAQYFFSCDPKAMRPLYLVLANVNREITNEERCTTDPTKYDFRPRCPVTGDCVVEVDWHAVHSCSVFFCSFFPVNM